MKDGDPDPNEEPILVDHESIALADIPSNWIDQAKQTLHIAYGHTSHGSQLTTGMAGLVTFAGHGVFVQLRRDRRGARPARLLRRLRRAGRRERPRQSQPDGLGKRDPDLSRPESDGQRHRLVLVRAGRRDGSRDPALPRPHGRAGERLSGRHLRLHDRAHGRGGAHGERPRSATSRSATTAWPTTRSSTTSPTSRATIPTAIISATSWSTTPATTTATATARGTATGRSSGRTPIPASGTTASRPTASRSTPT